MAAEKSPRKAAGGPAAPVGKKSPSAESHTRNPQKKNPSGKGAPASPASAAPPRKTANPQAKDLSGKTAPGKQGPEAGKKTAAPQPAPPARKDREPAGSAPVVRPRSGQEPLPQPQPGRIWMRVGIVLGPSLLLLFLLAAFPGLQRAIGSLFRSTPPSPPPTNLLPSVHDRLYHSPILFQSNQIIAYYGHPLARYMGIVGRHPMRELGPMLKRTAARYDRLNGSKGAVPAFYLIYGTAQPGGNILTMDKKLLDPYIRYTATNGFLLILDHQIGKYGPRHAVSRLLPYLKYPHVHLAIDPEWRTTRPMKEIGWVSGDELNEVQRMMRGYMLTNRIPGRRMLIVHQFENKMLVRRERARVAYDPVVLVHSISGWGTPSMKLNTYARGSQATNMPFKGFKLWYDPGMRVPGLHFDTPLMPPEQVLELRPEPMLIMYQ